MNLSHEKIKYIFSDSNSENDAILIGFLTAGIENKIKNLLYTHKRTIPTVTIDGLDESVLFSSPDSLNNKSTFDWSLCENLFLIKAYSKFTPKMKKIFDKYYLQDKPVSKIAKKEGCSQSSVYHILERCKEYITLEKKQEEKENASCDNN